MGMSLSRLERELEQWKNYAQEVTRRNEELSTYAESSFENSVLMRGMREELQMLRAAAEENELERDALAAENFRLKALLSEKGMVPSEDNPLLERQLLRLRIAELEGELAEKERRIGYLKSVFADYLYRNAEKDAVLPKTLEFLMPPDEAPADPTRKKRGRKPIDAGTAERVRRLRSQGASIRQIAAKEGISVGSVEKILRS